MKKFTKFLSVLVILSVLILSFALVACNVEEEPATEDATFDLVVLQFNGMDSQTYAVNTNGTVLATLKVPVKAGQTHVSDALEAIATKEGENFKVSLNKTDYLVFSSAWWLSNGHIASEEGYTAKDFSYSYMEIDGVASNGPTQDAVAGLKVFTIVIDGYDGIVGSV